VDDYSKDLTPGAVDSASAEEFVRVFSRSQYRILRFIHTLVPNLTEAEDILQETSVILWKKWPQFERNRDFVRWACGIARLEVFRMLRQKHRGALYLSEVVLNQVADLALADIQDAMRIEAGETALAACLMELPEPDREILSLRYQFDKTVQQIADDLRRPKSTIHDQLAKIRTRLLRCVRRRLAS
jgi:RNA polymerase sigma-70 factor (ECF subfamily)